MHGGLRLSPSLPLTLFSLSLSLAMIFERVFYYACLLFLLLLSFLDFLSGFGSVSACLVRWLLLRTVLYA
ncbi:hypothetical protein F4808DRAFT_426660 [Astrocystis sublimbata]|nr:hypothetical protein F4808DRAFT_426660 [Astrocystis sublimbata]